LIQSEIYEYSYYDAAATLVNSIGYLSFVGSLCDVAIFMAAVMSSCASSSDLCGKVRWIRSSTDEEGNTPWRR